MKENNIRRRDMIRISSLAALSNMLASALVSASVLQMGYAFEQATQIGSQRPKIAE